MPILAWHAIGVRAALAALEASGREGLSEKTAQERLSSLGPNSFPAPQIAVVHFLWPDEFFTRGPAGCCRRYRNRHGTRRHQRRARGSRRGAPGR
ncbi:MAG: cation-transporting P-type ATPase [Syntrophobacteraceae bacterium]